MKSTLIYELCSNECRFVCQETGRLAFCEWPLKSIILGDKESAGWGRQTEGAEGDRSEGNKVGAQARKGGLRGARLKGEREQLALPKAIKVWFTHSLNKSTYHPSLPFFQVCGSYHSVPTPTLPLALSFPRTLAWQNCEFQQGLCSHGKTVVHLVSPRHIFLHLLCLCVLEVCLMDTETEVALWATLATRRAISHTAVSFGIMQILKWFSFFALCLCVCVCLNKHLPTHSAPPHRPTHPPTSPPPPHPFLQPWQDFP